MAPLVGAGRDSVRLFLYGGLDYFIRRAVVCKVDHLGPGPLKKPPEDIDRSVVPVEKGGRRNEAETFERGGVFVDEVMMGCPLRSSVRI
jgi:hypothetical protein